MQTMCDDDQDDHYHPMQEQYEGGSDRLPRYFVSQFWSHGPAEIDKAVLRSDQPLAAVRALLDQKAAQIESDESFKEKRRARERRAENIEISEAMEAEIIASEVEEEVG